MVILGTGFALHQETKENKMAKKLKVWNGGGIYQGEYRNFSINVCAHTKKEAIELICKHLAPNISASHFSDFFSNCWGNDMQGIEPTEPCVYVCNGYGNNLKRIKIYPI